MPRSVLKLVDIVLAISETCSISREPDSDVNWAGKGRNAEAVGESCLCRDCVADTAVTKGSLSRWVSAPPQPVPGGIRVLDVLTSDAGNDRIRNSLEDLDDPSSGDKAVSRVSGVPLNESATPLEECGDGGLKDVSCSWPAMMRLTLPGVVRVMVRRAFCDVSVSLNFLSSSGSISRRAWPQ